MMITIKEATKKDYPRLVEIMNRSAEKEELSGFIPPRSVAQEFLVRLRQDLGHAGHGVFVAEMDRELVGFIYFIRKRVTSR
jgi:predicted N-acetyltransferase YhbS